MKSRCVVVIGHVDHGKTALVRVLTGTDTDRLPEEKARGLSITPGFAHHAYPDGVIDFIDAPGHADFIQGMISGASGAQAALVVIALADGIRAQTREHLSIAGLLGISRAVIAVTKSDLLDPSDQAARLSEIRATLAQTPFAAAPVVMCSAQTGFGIENLHAALAGLLSDPPSHSDALHSVLPIDRAFTLPGHGTIVTGTLLGQDLAMDADVVLQPAGHAVSIRGLQSRGGTRDAVHVGERVAANLRGIAAGDIPRGSVLCAPGIGTPSRFIDAHVALLPTHAQALKHMQEVRVLFGTSSAVGQVRRMKNQDGATPFVQLRFKNPVVCFAGQKAILRRLSPAETIGGAIFLDPQAAPARSTDARRLEVLKAAQQRDTKAIANALITAGRGCVELSDVARLARLTPAKTSVSLGDTFVRLNADMISSSEGIDAARTAMLNALAAYHLKHSLRPMAPRATIENSNHASQLRQYVEDTAVAKGHLRRNANMLALRDHDPAAQLTQDQRNALSDLEETFRQAGLDAASSKDASQSDHCSDLVQLLTDTGRLISLHNIALKQHLLLHVEPVARAATTLAAAFPKAQRFTTSQARATLGTSRRVVVPLLEHFDSLGVTVRQKDTRQIVNLNLVSPANHP